MNEKMKYEKVHNYFFIPISKCRLRIIVTSWIIMAYQRGLLTTAHLFKRMRFCLCTNCKAVVNALLRQHI